MQVSRMVAAPAKLSMRTLFRRDAERRQQASWDSVFGGSDPGPMWKKSKQVPPSVARLPRPGACLVLLLGEAS
jgi:hypothetical protein